MVAWKLMFRVTGIDQLRKKTEQVLKLLSVPLTVLSEERYYKIPELFVFSAQSNYDLDTLDEIVVAVLLDANRLGIGWFLTGLTVYPDHGLEFEGVFDIRQSGNAKIAGLEWASFSVMPAGEAMIE